ncbi:MAG: RagB/SusD family nutrient uptake outer membrane protein [Bacteroidia bacterium]
MKYVKLIIILPFFFLASCFDNFLNQPPLDRITENDVFKDRELMDSYIFKIYDNMPWDYLEDFDNSAGWGAHREVLSDIAMSTYSWTPSYNTFRPGNWGTANNTWPLDWWGYWNIWKINYAIEQISTLEEGILSKPEQDNRLGELYFMRSFCYFTMARRYGGVPIILEAQNPETTPQDELFPARNTEKEVYDQALADVEQAFNLLPDRWLSQKGRAGKWAAKALESRAALYAGSIAKYGTVDLNGLVGIPSENATYYYERSLAASEMIINQGGYTLFNQYPDPAENYYHLFVDETEDESIFVKVWIPFEKGHSYDLRNTPYSYRVDWGSSMSPTKQFMDSYEMLATGKLPEETGSGYDENNPFEGRDPRFKGTLLTNNDMFQGSRIETWYATERDGQLDTEKGTGVGKDGMGVHPDATKTGVYVRKYLADGGGQLSIQQYYSGQDCILFRLGEVYLNASEAAIEMNMEALAREYIEPIRRRAGLVEQLSLENYSGNDLKERIRNERKIEMAFEDHRYWDVRRWRTAVDDLSYRAKGIRSLRIIDGGGNETFSYDVINAEPQATAFYPRHYYLPIGLDRITNNPKLIENPGY